jgi:protein O-mannosyl-transferase
LLAAADMPQTANFLPVRGTVGVTALATSIVAALATRGSRSQARCRGFRRIMPVVEEFTPISPPSTTSAFRSDHRLVLVLAVLLALGTAFLYAPAARNGFVNYDDPDYVTQNPHVLQGVTWHNLIWAFGTDNPAANWHPLTWISHMVDVELYHANPAGHHFTNILLQTLNVTILFLFLQRITGFPLRSAAVAALFAVHPLNVESVAWIAERKAVLCMFFLLLTLWAYAWYAQKKSAARYLCVVSLFACALMSKIMVITLPFCLLLLDYWPLQRFPAGSEAADLRKFAAGFGSLVVEKIPLFVLAAGGGWITLYIHRKEGALAAAMPLAWRLKNAVYSYAVYLEKTIWPSGLAVFYPHPENTLPWWKVLLAAFLLVAITGIVWRCRTKRYLLVGWLWFVGTLVPMIGIVQSGRQGMADRYAYISLIGLFIAVVWLLADWTERWRLNESATVIAFAVLISPYIYVTRTQIGYWRDSYTLFTHALAVTRNNGIAEANLGEALMEKRQLELARPHFEAAVRLSPDLPTAHYNLGVVLQMQNHLEEAAFQYHQAIALFSDPMEAEHAHHNLAILYMELKNPSAALSALNAAIALNPNAQNNYMSRGTLELQFSNFEAAVADFSRAIQIAPSPEACYWLGRALEGNGDFPKAANAYAAALRLAPSMSEARARLEALQTSSGK